MYRILVGCPSVISILFRPFSKLTAALISFYANFCLKHRIRLRLVVCCNIFGSLNEYLSRFSPLGHNQTHFRRQYPLKQIFKSKKLWLPTNISKIKFCLTAALKDLTCLSFKSTKHATASFVLTNIWNYLILEIYYFQILPDKPKLFLNSLTFYPQMIKDRK